MGLPEVFLEHKRGDKQRFLRVKPHQKLFVIGSSKLADLRIAGEGIEGCHAALRFRDSSWYICDISGSESVKVNGQYAAEAKLDERAEVEIAGHRLQLFSKERETDLFNDSRQGAGSTGAAATTAKNSVLAMHQVVVSSNGRLIEAKLLKANEPYKYHDGERMVSLPAPLDGKWHKTESGKQVIQQRLVASQEVLSAERLEFDRDLRKSLVLSLIVFLFMLSSFFFMAPSADRKPEVALDTKSLDMIYNAKVVKKKKLEAQKVVKTAAAKAGGTSEQAPTNVAKASAPDESQAPKVSEKPSAALTSLRQSGLANLVGKIAKRANKQGILVAAVGVTPDTQGAGRAFYNTGTSTTGGGGSAAKEGPTYRLGGIATKGRAGGTGNFKEGTALAGGNVGSGDIVAMVDEETVIEGGLDRDAISDVIRRNLGQIRYCYERQLSSNPELYGKVLMKFTIGANGEVTEPHVDNSTLKSAMVEGCIARRMASWKFPEPKGGTQVRVSYPFLFKAY